MIRLSDTLLLGAAIAGAIYTFQIKHVAELSAKKIQTLNAQISAQNRKIALLEADWALETGPARLEKIAHQFQKQLQLRPLESSQIIDSSELPGLRQDRAVVDEEIYAGKDGEVVTGGIGDLIEREGDN